MKNPFAWLTRPATTAELSDLDKRLSVRRAARATKRKANEAARIRELRECNDRVADWGVGV